MSQPHGVQLLAARPSSGELAALFSGETEAPLPPVRARRAVRVPDLIRVSDLARRIVANLRLAVLAQVPCEDIALPPPERPQPSRTTTHT